MNLIYDIYITPMCGIVMSNQNEIALLQICRECLLKNYIENLKKGNIISHTTGLACVVKHYV